VNAIARRIRIAVVQRIDGAALPWPMDRIVQVALAVFIVAEVFAFLAGGLALEAVSAVAFVIAAWVALDVMQGRAAREVDRALPELLEATARSLRSGASLRVALGEAASHMSPRLAPGVAAAVTAAERGVPLVEVIDDWAANVPGEGVRLAAAALALSAELGGAAARSLDGVAATLRDRNGLRREVRALSSQARASAVVIGVAPLAFAVVAGSLDRRTIDFLLHTPAGIACLVFGVLLDGLGALWMHKLAEVR
jgi:tight adherence protein B